MGYLMQLFLIVVAAAPLTALASTTTVRVTSTGFVPAEVEIQNGDSVVFVNEDAAEHWVASDDHPTHTAYPGSDIRRCGETPIFDSCRGMRRADTFTMVFNSPGTWGYHDHLHPSLTGTVRVISQDAAQPKKQKVGISVWRRLQARILGSWYSFRPQAARVRVDDLNMLKVARSDADLEFWMRTFGYEALFDELVDDADNPENRTGSEERRLAQNGECHIVAHFTARMAYTLFGIDSLVENAIDTRCAFGFYHGVIEASLGSTGNDAVVADFAAQCERYAEDSIRRAFCAHAIGHAVMVHNGFDLPTALHKCMDLVPSEAGKRMCYHGAYMENSFGALGVGMSEQGTAWMRNDDPDFPCTSDELPDDLAVRQMCYTNQSIIWGRKSLSQFDEKPAIAGCDRSPNTVRAMCFTGLGFNMAFARQGGTFTDDEVIRRCDLSPRASDRHNCLLGAIMMRATHWRTFSGFRLPAYCTALGKDDLEECNRYVFEQFAWLNE